MSARARAAHRLAWLILAAVTAVAVPGVHAADALLYRIFLRDGSTLVSYGDFARVADRVVFSIPISGVEGASPVLHLVSISEAVVDWTRTDEYAEAARARRYAETRGEADFDRLSAQLARILSEVTKSRNPADRLALATGASRMLANWPAAHYGYRAADVAQLSAMLDGVVSDLRAAAGQTRFDLSLVATAQSLPPNVELLPPPTLRESVEQVFKVASVTPEPTERISLLESIRETLKQPAADAAWAAALSAKASAVLLLEQKTDRDYQDLVARTMAASNERAQRADVNGIEALVRAVLKADDSLGRKRPQTTAALLASARCAAERRAPPAAGARCLEHTSARLSRVSAAHPLAARTISPGDDGARADTPARRTVAAVAAAPGGTPVGRLARHEAGQTARGGGGGARALRERPADGRPRGCVPSDGHHEYRHDYRLGSVVGGSRSAAAVRARAGGLAKAQHSTVIVITPRTTRLIRVPDLRSMHRAIAECVGVAPGERRRAVVVPTESAAGALRRTLPGLPGGVEIVTRDGFHARLHEGLGGSPPMLSDFEREVLFRRAAEAASDGGAPAPFRLRSGLIVEILAFYDELRRRDRTVADFDRLMTDSLIASVDSDRGAERMFRQTRFLAAAFVEFERRVEASGALDEHGLRRRLLQADAISCFSGVALTVADQPADPRGMWTVDYDLLARMNGIERIDVIATENVLATGFHERVHDLLPGIEESRRDASMPAPVLVAPAAGPGDAPLGWFVCRDREEELAGVARSVRAAADPDRSAAVIPRPLPYLYLARHVFEDAHEPYRASDSLPLAVEPFAAALDLVFAFATTEANRASIVDLLGSPHWQFAELTGPDMAVRESVAALDVALRQQKYLGGWDRLAVFTVGGTKAGDGLRAAAGAAEALRPLREAATASEQIRALLAFVAAHERPADPAAPWHARHLRARGAVLDALTSLARAHEQHDDRALSVELLAATVRRWIEAQTFAPGESRDGTPSPRGVALLDVSSAAYADVDDLRLLGLVESDWPERSRRSIFYPTSLLTHLGWPNEADRLTAARARFRDLLRLPRERVSLSTFTLENDAIVSPSPFLEEVETCGLAIERLPASQPRVFVHEALVEDPPDAGAVRDDAAQWLALRASRSPADDEAFHGAGGPRAPGDYAISHLERYLECPFKYFAAHVLRLDEERDDESGLSPQERGQLIHDVFEEFFAAWNQRGGKAITAANLGEAVELFETVAEATIAELPEADRALERTCLLGSAAAAGLAERAFNFEIEQDVDVVERLLEHRLDGEYDIAGTGGPRTLRLRAKADRIDLLHDGTLRVIDYKLGRAPKSARALQLPVYGVCAEQQLEGRHGRNWAVSRAGYVAFKEKNSFVSLGASSSLKEALEEGQERLLTAVGGIERGDFPPRPEEPFLCTRCGYAGVCRKDYVGDE